VKAPALSTTGGAKLPQAVGRRLPTALSEARSDKPSSPALRAGCWRELCSRSVHRSSALRADCWRDLRSRSAHEDTCDSLHASLGRAGKPVLPQSSVVGRAKPRPTAGETVGLALSPAGCAGFQRDLRSRSAYVVGGGSSSGERISPTSRSLRSRDRPAPFSPTRSSLRPITQLPVDQSDQRSAYLQPSACLSRVHPGEVRDTRLARGGPTPPRCVARTGCIPVRCHASPLDW
jgi:hypothetical protein